MIRTEIVIISAAYPFRGGISHFTQMLYNELVKEHQVSVITFSRQYPNLLFPGKTQYEPSELKNAPPSEAILDSINPISWFSVGKKIKKLNADLIIFNFWMPFFSPCFGTVARQISKNKKSKILVIAHNVISHDAKPGDKLLTKYFFNAADYFVTMSKSVKADLNKFKPNAKQKLLFHPIYSNFGSAVEKNESQKHLHLSVKPTLLFFGFIRKYKGLDVLLKAIELLKGKIDLQLVVAGEFYDSKQKYLDLIENLNIKNNVKIFSDFIPNDEVKYYFSAAEVVVLPYREATQSGIFQIANNFEKPIIAANVGGLGEEIENGKTGYVVEKNNPQALADAIFKFINEQKNNEFSANVRDKKEKYSWKNFVLGIEELTSD